MSLTSTEVGEIAKNQFIHGFFGNVFFRMNTMYKAGEVHDGHTHHFDHVTFLTHGSIVVKWRSEKRNGVAEFKAPMPIIIKADCHHEITALEDGTVYFCVFAMRDLDGDVSEVFDGSMSPYV